MSRDQDKRISDGQAGKGKRRPYAKPVLIEYGSIAKLTQSGGSTTNEPAIKMKPCL